MALSGALGRALEMRLVEPEHGERVERESGEGAFEITLPKGAHLVEIGLVRDDASQGRGAAYHLSLQ